MEKIIKALDALKQSVEVLEKQIDFKKNTNIITGTIDIEYLNEAVKSLNIKSKNRTAKNKMKALQRFEKAVTELKEAFTSLNIINFAPYSPLTLSFELNRYKRIQDVYFTYPTKIGSLETDEIDLFNFIRLYKNNNGEFNIDHFSDESTI